MPIRPTRTEESSGAVDPPVRVLIVEDEEADYFLVARLLSRGVFARYVTTWRASYEEGLAALAGGEGDVAIVDFRLGAGTGLELIRAAQARGCEAPIILLAGQDSIEVDRESTRAGAADYLCKDGLTSGQLERAIRYALRHSRTMRELRQSEGLMESFLQHVPCAVAIYDADGRVIFQNALFAEHMRDFAQELHAGPSRMPWILRDEKRSWLVSTFSMPETGGRVLTGLAAIDTTERWRAEEERLRQAHLLDSMMRNLPVIVGRLDDTGRVVEARGGLERCGIDAAEIMGRDFAALFPASRDALWLAANSTDASFSLRGRVGDREWHAEFYLAGSAAGGISFFGRDVTERRWLERQLLTAADAEQQRIGADLHDGLGQKLTGLACVATALRDRLKSDAPELIGQATLIAALARDATMETRALARGLCPVQLDEAGGLVAAIEELVENTELIHRVRCRSRVRIENFTCSDLVATQLYRIAQEAITNTIRHGGAENIEVSLERMGDDFRLAIADDGRGFTRDPRASVRRGGLRIMEYRATMIGGSLTVDSEPALGTRVICIFPASRPEILPVSVPASAPGKKNC